VKYQSFDKSIEGGKGAVKGRYKEIDMSQTESQQQDGYLNFSSQSMEVPRSTVNVQRISPAKNNYMTVDVSTVLNTKY